ncbi:hypothetical protein BH09BAC5_BH09BAC5_11340 [soil metagenome]
MDIEKPLVIGYSGSLSFFDGDEKFGSKRKCSLRDWVWTYNYKVTDPTTRSAYYLFKAISMLKKKYNITPEQLIIDLWGNIHPGNIELAIKLGISDIVQISGYLPKNESIKRLSRCDILFLPMESATGKNKPLFIPGKAFEYMKSGRPILSLAGSCDCLDILKPSGLLIEFNPTDSNNIADYIYKLISERKLLENFIVDTNYIKQFSFQNITKKLVQVFDDVLKK